MPQHKTIAARLRTVLLATTGLVVAGCNTISDQSATADPSQNGQSPVVVTSVAEKDSGKLSTETLIRIADRAWAKSDAPTALRLYATAAKDDPKNPAPLMKIAEVLRKTGRAENAIGIYTKVLEIDSSYVDAHHGIGYSYLQIEKPYLATDAFAAALVIDEENAKSLGGMAVAYDKAGDRENAQSYYKKAIKADPANLNYKANLALSLALSGDTEKAIAILKVVAEHPGATAKHRQNLALVYGMAGQSKEAMKYSRMDLSEKDARNNALYFEALNGSPDEQVAVLGEQVKVMKASADKALSQIAMVNSQPRQPKNPEVIIARVETEVLDVNAGSMRKSRPAILEAPKNLVPAPVAPVMVAKADAPAEKKPAVAAKSPVPAAPVMMAKTEPPAAVKPVKTEKTSAPTKTTVAATPKPATFGKKSETPAAPVAVAEAKPASAPFYKEWKVEKKVAPVAKPTEPVVATSGETSSPMKEQISFVPRNTPINGEVSPIKPDGGKYALQLGSYKERARAEKGWEIVQSQNVDILGDIEPVISQADLGAEGGGSFYRVQIAGFSNKADLMRLCGTLRDRSFDCFMPMGAKSEAPKKTTPSTLGPDQRMVDSAPKNAPKTVAKNPETFNDSTIIAESGKGFGAL